MGFLADKETKSKGLLLWIILITVGLYIIIGLIVQYLISDNSEIYQTLKFKPNFPIKKIMTIITIARIFILICFVGIIYNIKEGITGMWIGYILITVLSILSAAGMEKLLMNGIEYFIPLIYLIIPTIITLLLRPIKDSFKKIISPPK